MENNESFANLLYSGEMSPADAADALESGRWLFVDEFGRRAGPGVVKRPAESFPMFQTAIRELQVFADLKSNDEARWGNYLAYGVEFDEALSRDYSPALNEIYPIDAPKPSRNSASHAQRVENGSHRVIAALLQFICGTHISAIGQKHPLFESREQLVDLLTNESAREETGVSRAVLDNRIADAIDFVEREAERTGVLGKGQTIEELVFGKRPG